MRSVVFNSFVVVWLTGTVFGVVAASIFGGAFYALFEEEDPPSYLFAFTLSSAFIGAAIAVTCQFVLSKMNNRQTAKLFLDLINKEK